VTSTTGAQLQVVQKQRERMFRLGKYADKLSEDCLEARLRVRRGHIGRRRLLADNEFQLRDEVQDEGTLWTQCLKKVGAPFAQLELAPA
jgi:hypothetical protein